MVVEYGMPMRHRAPPPRPKSAAASAGQLRQSLSLVKAMATSASQPGLRVAPRLEKYDAVKDGLLLDHDSRLRVRKTYEAREREMRGIVTALGLKYNQQRLTLDRKAADYDRLKAEAEVLSAFDVGAAGVEPAPVPSPQRGAKGVEARACRRVRV
jgi:hypothetical protein